MYMDRIKKNLEERKKVAVRNICYFDENNNIVEKEKGKYCIITEYDKDGHLIKSIHGICNNMKDKNKEEER